MLKKGEVELMYIFECVLKFQKKLYHFVVLGGGVKFLKMIYRTEKAFLLLKLLRSDNSYKIIGLSASPIYNPSSRI